MKIRSGCEGGGKGPLVQNDLSATLATHQDQTVFAPKVCGFIYKQGAKAGNIGAGEVAPTMKTDQPPAAAYANGAETVARTLTARADGSPMLDRGPNLIVQKGNGNEKDYCD
jgi:DNA (cytosine-5)-methyltransferase 1